MKQSTLICRTMTYSRNDLSTLISSLYHSFRVAQHKQKVNKNFKKEKQEFNIIHIKNNEKFDSFNDNNISDLEKKNYVENILKKDFNNKNNVNIELSKSIKTARDKISRYINNSKFAKEQEYFENLLKLNSEEIFEKQDDLIKEFRELSSKNNIKISKFTDKLARIKNYISNKIEQKESKNIKKNTIKIAEMIFKIPIHNNISLTSKESMIIQEDFIKKYFKDYEIIAKIEHNDENKDFYKDYNSIDFKKSSGELGAHAHIFFSTFNKKTSEYDYTKTLKNIVIKNDEKLKEDLENLEKLEKLAAKNIENNDKYYLKTDKEKEELTKKEVGKINAIRSKKIGEGFQDLVYNFANNHPIIKSKNIELVKHLHTQTLTRKEKYLLKNDNKKATQDRAFNGNNFDLELLEYASKNRKEYEEMKQKLENKARTLKNNNIDLATEKIKKIEKDFETLLIENTKKTNIEILKIEKNSGFFSIKDNLINYIKKNTINNNIAKKIVEKQEIIKQEFINFRELVYNEKINNIAEEKLKMINKDLNNANNIIINLNKELEEKNKEIEEKKKENYKTIAEKDNKIIEIKEKFNDLLKEKDGEIARAKINFNSLAESKAKELLREAKEKTDIEITTLRKEIEILNKTIEKQKKTIQEQDEIIKNNNKDFKEFLKILDFEIVNNFDINEYKNEIKKTLIKYKTINNDYSKILTENVNHAIKNIELNNKIEKLKEELKEYKDTDNIVLKYAEITSKYRKLEENNEKLKEELKQYKNSDNINHRSRR